ncbi:MAG: hypothetical protein HQ564_08375 [Candidatus Saganbacteria bacterium]|nr:hypothetical protein [Candidatus Saganbacteria bacterium]
MSLFTSTDNFLTLSILPLIIGAGPIGPSNRPSDILWRKTMGELKKNGIIKDKVDSYFLRQVRAESRFLDYVIMNRQDLLRKEQKGRKLSKLSKKSLIKSVTENGVPEKLIWHMLATLMKPETKKHLHHYIIRFLAGYFNGRNVKKYRVQRRVVHQPPGGCMGSQVALPVSILTPSRLFQQIKVTAETSKDPLTIRNFSKILAEISDCPNLHVDKCKFDKRAGKTLSGYIVSQRPFVLKKQAVDAGGKIGVVRLLYINLKKTSCQKTKDYIIAVLISNKDFNYLSFWNEQDVFRRALKLLKSSKDADNIEKCVKGLTKALSRRTYGRQLFEISGAFLDILEKPKQFAAITAKHREAIGYALVKKYHSFDDATKRRMIGLVGKKNELSRFLATLLLPKVKDAKILKQLKQVVPQVEKSHPPYKSIYRRGKNEINFRLYFLSDTFYSKKWKRWLKKEKFSRKVVNGSHLYSKMVGRRRVNLWATTPGLSKKGINIFESMNDGSKTDFVAYFGHAGGGAELSLSMKQAVENKKSETTILVSACSSFPHYAPRIFSLYPKAHFIGSVGSSWEPDNPRLFSAIFKGILAKRSWKSIKSPLHLYGGWKDNYIFPHEKEQLAYRDSDGDGIPNRSDPVYNLTRNERPTLYNDFNYRATSVEPAQNLGETISYLHARFHPNSFLKHFRDIRVPTTSADSFRNKGWFRHRQDKQNLIKEPRLRQGENGSTYFDIEINAGYQFCNARALKMMAVYELYRYFAKSYDLKGRDKSNLKPIRNWDFRSLTSQQKFWAYIKAVEVWALELHSTGGQSKKNELKELHKKFLEKYKLPKTLTFDLSYKAYWAKEIAGTEVTAETDAALKKVKEIWGYK